MYVHLLPKSSHTLLVPFIEPPPQKKKHYIANPRSQSHYETIIMMSK